jgi:tRNA U54 and U55 pseudouridine synthase Pus10
MWCTQMRVYGIQMHASSLVWSMEYIHTCIHTPYEKSLIERVNKYLKDRTKGFDDHSLIPAGRRDVAYRMLEGG